MQPGDHDDTSINSSGVIGPVRTTLRTTPIKPWVPLTGNKERFTQDDLEMWFEGPIALQMKSTLLDLVELKKAGAISEDGFLALKQKPFSRPSCREHRRAAAGTWGCRPVLW